METLFGTYILDLLSNYYRYGMQLEIFLYTTSWEYHSGKIFMPYFQGGGTPHFKMIRFALLAYFSDELFMKYVCFIVK